MIEHESGLPFDPNGPEFDAALRGMYQDVTTDGLATMQIGGAGQGKALGNQHAEERFFVFADAAAHLAYAEQFGKTGVVEGMMRHLDRMARDNAAMQRFGANPAATIRMLGDMVVQQAAKTTGFAPRPARKWYELRRSNPTDRAVGAARQLRETYEVFMGSHQNMIPKYRAIATGFDAFRSYQVAGKLGGAYISAAPGDLATQSVTRSFNGLPQAKMIPEYLKLIAPTDGSLAERQALIRHGAMAADWAQSGAEAHRLMGEQAEGQVMKRISDVTLRLSALSKHTDVARQLYVKGVNAGVADFVHLSFDRLPPKFAAGIDRYGIGADEWDKVRATPLEEAHGTMWFNPMRIEDGKVRDAYLRMVHTEKRFAVPEVDLRTKTMLASNLQRGDWLGESMKTLFLFKGFGLTLMNTHGRRALGQGGAAGARFFAAYAVRMGILTTLAGAVAIQIRNLLRGQDPEPMDEASFVGRAVAQGGGFGIFGDFLKASENRFGGGIAATIAGPAAGTAGNLTDLTYGNATKALRGEKINIGKDIVRIMRQEVPVASSLWYLRPAYDRLLVEEMDALANPDHEQDQEALQRRMAQQGKPFYAPPGSGPISWRAPDWGNAVGDPGAEENVLRMEGEAAGQ